jgi:hypothetical protein
LGWALATAGYYGPWIADETAALTLSGVDMGEFVKFLPDVIGGSLRATRQLFYLPPLAVALSVALLVGCQRLRYSKLARIVFLTLAISASLQLLPPAWSVHSLLAPEFRVQIIALVLSWMALAGFWLWGAVPAGLTGVLSSMVAAAGLVLAPWQLANVKPAIDEVYRTPPTIGWGFYLCQLGLAVMVAASLLLALQSRQEWSMS